MSCHYRAYRGSVEPQTKQQHTVTDTDTDTDTDTTHTDTNTDVHF